MNIIRNILNPKKYNNNQNQSNPQGNQRNNNQTNNVNGNNKWQSTQGSSNFNGGGNFNPNNKNQQNQFNQPQNSGRGRARSNNSNFNGLQFNGNGRGRGRGRGQLISQQINQNQAFSQNQINPGGMEEEETSNNNQNTTNTQNKNSSFFNAINQTQQQQKISIFQINVNHNSQDFFDKINSLYLQQQEQKVQQNILQNQKSLQSMQQENQIKEKPLQSIKSQQGIQQESQILNSNIQQNKSIQMQNVLQQEIQEEQEDLEESYSSYPIIISKKKKKKKKKKKIIKELKPILQKRQSIVKENIQVMPTPLSRQSSQIQRKQELLRQMQERKNKKVIQINNNPKKANNEGNFHQENFQLQLQNNILSEIKQYENSSSVYNQKPILKQIQPDEFEQEVGLLKPIFYDNKMCYDKNYTDRVDQFNNINKNSIDVLQTSWKSFEVYELENQNQVENGCKPKPDREKAILNYIKNPQDVGGPIRTPDAIYKAVQFIVKEVIDVEYQDTNKIQFITPSIKDKTQANSQEYEYYHAFYKIYNFVIDRFRAVNQDIKRLKSKEPSIIGLPKIIKSLEQIVRYMFISLNDVRNAFVDEILQNPKEHEMYELVKNSMDLLKEGYTYNKVQFQNFKKEYYNLLKDLPAKEIIEKYGNHTKYQLQFPLIGGKKHIEEQPNFYISPYEPEIRSYDLVFNIYPQEPHNKPNYDFASLTKIIKELINPDEGEEGSCLLLFNNIQQSINIIRSLCVKDFQEFFNYLHDEQVNYIMGNVMLFHINYVREAIFLRFVNQKKNLEISLEELSDLLYFSYPQDQQYLIKFLKQFKEIQINEMDPDNITCHIKDKIFSSFQIKQVIRSLQDPPYNNEQFIFKTLINDRKQYMNEGDIKIIDKFQEYQQDYLSRAYFVSGSFFVQQKNQRFTDRYDNIYITVAFNQKNKYPEQQYLLNFSNQYSDQYNNFYQQQIKSKIEKKLNINQPDKNQDTDNNLNQVQLSQQPQLDDNLQKSQEIKQQEQLIQNQQPIIQKDNQQDQHVQLINQNLQQDDIKLQQNEQQVQQEEIKNQLLENDEYQQQKIKEKEDKEQQKINENEEQEQQKINEKENQEEQQLEKEEEILKQKQQQAILQMQQKMNQYKAQQYMQKLLMFYCQSLNTENEQLDEQIYEVTFNKSEQYTIDQQNDVYQQSNEDFISQTDKQEQQELIDVIDDQVINDIIQYYNLNNSNDNDIQEQQKDTSIKKNDILQVQEQYLNNNEKQLQSEQIIDQIQNQQQLSFQEYLASSIIENINSQNQQKGQQQNQTYKISIVVNEQDRDSLQKLLEYLTNIQEIKENTNINLNEFEDQSKIQVQDQIESQSEGSYNSNENSVISENNLQKNSDFNSFIIGDINNDNYITYQQQTEFYLDDDIQSDIENEYLNNNTQLIDLQIQAFINIQENLPETNSHTLFYGSDQIIFLGNNNMQQTHSQFDTLKSIISNIPKLRSNQRNFKGFNLLILNVEDFNKSNRIIITDNYDSETILQRQILDNFQSYQQFYKDQIKIEKYVNKNKKIIQKNTEQDQNNIQKNQQITLNLNSEENTITNNPNNISDIEQYQPIQNTDEIFSYVKYIHLQKSDFIGRFTNKSLQNDCQKNFVYPYQKFTEKTINQKILKTEKYQNQQNMYKITSLQEILKETIEYLKNKYQEELDEKDIIYQNYKQYIEFENLIKNIFKGVGTLFTEIWANKSSISVQNIVLSDYIEKVNQDQDQDQDLQISVFQVLEQLENKYEKKYEKNQTNMINDLTFLYEFNENQEAFIQVCYLKNIQEIQGNYQEFINQHQDIIQELKEHTDLQYFDNIDDQKLDLILNYNFNYNNFEGFYFQYYLEMLNISQQIWNQQPQQFIILPINYKIKNVVEEILIPKSQEYQEFLDNQIQNFNNKLNEYKKINEQYYTQNQYISNKTQTSENNETQNLKRKADNNEIQIEVDFLEQIKKRQNLENKDIGTFEFKEI